MPVKIDSLDPLPEKTRPRRLVGVVQAQVDGPNPKDHHELSEQFRSEVTISDGLEKFQSFVANFGKVAKYLEKRKQLASKVLEIENSLTGKQRKYGKFKVGSAVTGIMGGGLLAGGAVATVVTGGVAAPVLIAGAALSSTATVSGCTGDIGTAVHNNKAFKEIEAMQAEFVAFEEEAMVYICEISETFSHLFEDFENCEVKGCLFKISNSLEKSEVVLENVDGLDLGPLKDSLRVAEDLNQTLAHAHTFIKANSKKTALKATAHVTIHLLVEAGSHVLFGVPDLLHGLTGLSGARKGVAATDKKLTKEERKEKASKEIKKIEKMHEDFSQCTEDLFQLFEEGMFSVGRQLLLLQVAVLELVFSSRKDRVQLLQTCSNESVQFENGQQKSVENYLKELQGELGEYESFKTSLKVPLANIKTCLQVLNRVKTWMPEEGAIDDGIYSKIGQESFNDNSNNVEGAGEKIKNKERIKNKLHLHRN